jgi:hypothetical protein
VWLCKYAVEKRGISDIIIRVLCSKKDLHSLSRRTRTSDFGSVIEVTTYYFVKNNMEDVEGEV